MENQNPQESTTCQRSITDLFKSYNSNFRTKQNTIANGNEDVEQLMAIAYRSIVSERGRILSEMDGNALKRINEFVKGNGKRWLLMMGTPGTGKTTYLNAIRRIAQFCNKDEIGSIIAVKASDIGGTMKNDGERYDKMKNSTILLIDDIGFGGEAEVVNNYGVKAMPVNDILESRYDSMKLTVMTTNLNGEQLKERYGERIFSRMCELCEVVNFTGIDYRKLNL